PVLFCPPFVQRHRWCVGSHCFEWHPDFQYRRNRDDDRCAVYFFLDGCDVYVLALCGEKPEFFVALAGYGSADRLGISLQVHECVRIDFGVSRTGARSTAATGIQTPRRLFADRDVRSLHDSVDCVERAACLDHAGAFALAWESRAWVRFS